MGTCSMVQETQTGALYQPRGGVGREMGGRFKREGMYVYPWLIHVEVWQKTRKFCKAIILQQQKNKTLCAMPKQINRFQSVQWGSVKIREQTIEITLPFTLIHFKVIFLLLPIAVYRNLVPYLHGRCALCSRRVHSVYVMVCILGC